MHKKEEKVKGSDPTTAAVGMPLRVLMLEDNPRDVELSLQELKKAGFKVQADTVDT